MLPRASAGLRGVPVRRASRWEARARSAPQVRRQVLCGAGKRAELAAGSELKVNLATGTFLPEDVAHLASAHGGERVTIAGFGSLLSERSARYTMPSLSGFRQGVVKGFARYFQHTAPVFYERGIARPETGEVSSLSVEPTTGCEIVVTLFEVPLVELPAFVEREHEFRFSAVEVEGEAGLAIMCLAYTDARYRSERCKDAEEYERRYGRHGVDRIWRSDILPCRTYLRHCVLAAQNLGPTAYASFMDATFLADRRTTVRAHLANDPSIMSELPPPELAERYSG